MSDRIESAARRNFEDQKSHGQMVRLPQDIRPRSLEEAYRVQDRLIEMYREAGMGDVVGWKIALTSAVQQKKFGVDHPFAGAMVASRIKPNGAELRFSDYAQIGVESEIVVKLARDLPIREKPYTRAEVTDAVESCMAGIEVADLRNVVIPEIDVTVIISDNAMNYGCITASPVKDWRKLDLAALTCKMIVNGTVVGEGHGRDALGHPMEALAWLANHLVQRGRHLKAGDLVMTGSLVVNKLLAKGDEMATEIESLGTARLKVV
ncbi:MAG: fumarylacetoacetate hydrolase family protein [Alphaproteobacteria bacterium]